MQLLYLLALIFLVLTLIFNVTSNLPRIPGDIYIDKPGIKIYIPFASAIAISVFLTILLNFFRK